MIKKAEYSDIKSPFYGFENSKQKLPKAIFAMNSTLNTQLYTLYK